MRGNEEGHMQALAAEILEFQIPMRGNETTTILGQSSTTDQVFQIPMRGNEARY